MSPEKFALAAAAGTVGLLLLPRRRMQGGRRRTRRRPGRLGGALLVAVPAALVLSRALAGEGSIGEALLLRTALWLVGVAAGCAIAVGVVLAWQPRWRRGRLLRLAGSDRGRSIVRAMDWRTFEQLVGEAFRRRGYRVAERGGHGSDGGVDLVLRRGCTALLVQCKHWRSTRVSVQVVRELLGVVTAERASGGVVVTSGRFTRSARAFAQKQRVELIDGQTLYRWIREQRESDTSGCSDRSAAPIGPARAR